MLGKQLKMNQYFKRLASQIAHSKQIQLSYGLGIDVLSNIQTVCFILTTIFNFQSPNKGFLIKCVENILIFFEEIGTIGANNQPYLLFILLGYFLYHLCLFLLLPIFQVYQQGTKIKKVVKVMAMVYLLHSRIACPLITCLLAVVMNYQNACNQVINDLWICEQIWYILSVFLCVINIGLALLQEFFLYRVTKNKDAYAVKNNYFHQIILFQKTITIFLYFFISDQELKSSILSAINFLLSFIAIAVLYKKLPFYNMKIMKENMIMTTLALTSSFISLLRMSGISQNALEIAWIFLYFLMLKICFGCFNNLFHKILQGKADTPERAIHFILLLKQSKYGYVTPFLFEQECQSETLIINRFLFQNKISSETIKKSKSNDEYQKNVYILGMAYLEKVLDIYPDSEVLILFMAHIYHKRLKNIMKAMAFIKTLHTSSTWVDNSIQDFKLRLREAYILESVMNDKEEKLDLIEYFHSRGNTNQAKSNMLKEIGKHIEFWKELKNERVDVKNIIMITKEIDAIYNILTKIQQQIDSFSNQYFANLLMLFAIYLEIIQENSQDAKKFISKFLNMNHSALSHFLDVYSEKEAVIILPLETEKFGRILDVSGSAQGFFHTTKKEIIGKPLELFLSSITINQLLKIIQTLFSVVTEKSYNYVIGYAKTQSGSIFEVDITLRFYPDIQNDIKVMIFIKKSSSPKLMMIINSSGDILECSAKLQKRFNLPTNQLRMTKLQDILLNYNQMNLTFNNGITDIKTNEYKPLTSGSPKTFKYPFSGVDNLEKMIGSDENIKKRSSNAFKALGKTAPPDLYEQEFSQRISNQPFSMTQSETKLTYLEKRPLVFNFIPLKNSENIQYAYNVEIQPYNVCDESYKVLSLIRISHKSRAVESNVTLITKALSEKNEVKSSEDEDDYVTMKKVTKIIELKQNAVNNNSEDQIIPESNDLNSPKLKKSYTLKPVKSQEVKKNINLRAVKTPVKRKQTERDTSISGTSSGNLLSVKILRNFFNGNKFHYSLKKICILIYMIMILMAFLGGINLVLADKSLEEILAGIKIVNFAGLRLAQSLRGWQLATIIYTRYIRLREGPADPFRTELYDKGREIIESNKQLQEIAAQLQSDLRTELYRKDINLWDFNETSNFNNNQTNSFIASNLLSNKMVFVGNTSLNYRLPIVINEVLFLINNTGNEYLISSEKMISVTQIMLKSMIQDNITTLQLILVAESLSVAILCLALILSGREILNSHKNLFRSLAKIDHSQIEDRIITLERIKELLTQDIETRQFGIDALEILRTPLRENVKSRNEKNYRQKELKLKFNGFVVYLVKYVSISLVTLQIVTIMFIVNLLQSISNFEEFDRVNNQLQVTIRARSRMSTLVSSFFIEIMFHNTSSVLIRNQAPNVQLKDIINQLRQTNTDLASAFYNMETDSFIQELLERRICTYLTSDLQVSCKVASKVGDKETGLYAVNMKLFLTVEYYTGLYFSNPTYDNAKLFVESYGTRMKPLTDTLDQTYFILNNYIVTNFQEKKDIFQMKTINMFIFLLLSLACSQLVIQGLTLCKLNSLDICRRHILRTVSYKILLENKALKLYLNRHFVVKME